MYLKTLFTFLGMLIVLNLACHHMKENFISKNLTPRKFFILQRKHVNPSFVLTNSVLSNHSKKIYTIKTIDSKCVIGYTNANEKRLLMTLIRLHNPAGNIFDLKFKKLHKATFDDPTIDILLYTNDAVFLKKYLIIDYYIKLSPDEIYEYFKNYTFVVYNDVNNSHLVLQETDKEVEIKHDDIELVQKESLSNEYHFVIENTINGKYREIDLHTNEITLFQNKLANLEVRVNDQIQLKNQKYSYMNGIYTVYKVNKYIHMRMSNIKTIPKHFVCIDENLEEQPKYTNKPSCIHENDSAGDKKTKSMVWDARCSRNTECPFFEDDYEYYCTSNGYCNMPKNVKQISFTKYKKI